MRDSDGYILIDMSAADITRSTQNISGIFDRIQKVIDTNKVVLVINFGDYSPMPAIAHKRLNYYVITTTLFIITINTNDVVLIEEAGQTTVDVSIVPTLLDGVKIADYSIGELEGSLYAPEQVDVINDNVTAQNTTWSSDKIDDELDTKADTASLATVATSGSYNDLSNTPTLAAVATSGSYNDLSNTPTIPDELNDLSDVTLTTPSNGQTLVYDGTKFVNQTPPTGVTTLAGLSDVTLTTPASGNLLSYDGSKWVNDNINADDISYSAGVSVADKIDEVDAKTGSDIPVSDSDPTSIAAAVAGLANVYSTSETVCGVWTDGNPIYRKVIPFSNVTITNNAWTSLVTVTGATIALSAGMITDGADDYMGMPLYFKVSDKTINVFNNLGGNIPNKSGQVIVEYLKT